MKAPLLVIILATLTTQFSAAQSDYRTGYLIKNSGDSLRGFLAYGDSRKSHLFCSFKPIKDAAAVTYRPSEILSYGFYDDKKFESKYFKLDSTEATFQFLEVLVQGPVNLLRLHDIFYIEKNGDFFSAPS